MGLVLLWRFRRSVRDIYGWQVVQSVSKDWIRVFYRSSALLFVLNWHFEILRILLFGISMDP